MKKNIQIHTTFEGNKIKQLKKIIYKKQQTLEELTMKTETLKMQLDLIRHEYHVRIGSLILKDNHLDLEILQLKNLKDLMLSGMSYAQALKHEEDKFYNEILRMQKEQEEIQQEEELLNGRLEVNDEEEQEIKEIWKRLIRKFHPDLVTDKKEKIKREAIMKQINRAYTQNDRNTLKKLETGTTIDEIADSTIEQLEKILIDIENMIVVLTKEYSLLQQSEWFGWKKKLAKAKKNKEDIFSMLENDILDDIAKKISVLQKLREEIGHHPIL